MYFQPSFDLFYPHPPKPTLDLFWTYFKVFGVSGLLGGLLLLKFGWPRMSGRRTSGSSRPSLGVQVLAAFFFIS